MEYHTSFAIGNARIAPGARRTVDLPVSVLSDHTPVTMSAHVIHGRRPGPTVFVTAGVHGDEIIGVEIVRRLLGQPALAQLKGTLIAIPIVNTYGFLARSRYLPDRRDLNRSFPGSAHGPASARLADALLGLVARYRPVLVLDLHEALPVRDGVVNELANSLIISESQGTGTAGASGLSAAELALDLSEGPPLPGGQTLTLLAGAPAGSFNRVASERYAVPVITVESNRGEALSARIDYHRTIVRRLLEAIGGAPR